VLVPPGAELPARERLLLERAGGRVVEDLAGVAQAVAR
jgi:hypothetical protein